MTRIVSKSYRIAKREKISEGLLLLYAIIYGFLFMTNNSLHIPFILLSIPLLTFYSKHLGLVAYIIMTIIQPEFSSAELFAVMFEASLIGVMIMKGNKNKGVKMLLGIDLFFMMVMIIGMLLGCNSKMVSILLYAFTLFMSVFVAKTVIDNEGDLMLRALLYGSLIMALFTGYNYATGNVEIYSSQGRLMFEEHAKTLSSALAIPILMSIDNFFNYKFVKNKYVLLFWGCVFLLCFPLFILTYSRGITIALIVAVFILYVLYTNSAKMSSTIIAIVVGIVVYSVSLKLEMESNLWLSNLEGGNGRTEIWKIHFDYMSQKGVLAWIFGLGTADLKSVLDWNPHSVILAQVFHFGFWGFLFIVFQTLTPLIRLFNKRKFYPFPLSLCVLAIIAFSTHGGYSDGLFWTIIGISLGYAYCGSIRIKKLL